MAVTNSDVAMQENTSEGIEAYLGVYEDFPAQGEPGWLQKIRGSAIARFAETGIPGTREEEWKYTNLSFLKNKSYQRPGEEVSEEAAVELNALDLPGLVFVNGVYSEKLSNLPEAESGITIMDMAAAIESRPADIERLLGQEASSGFQVFSSLNTALFNHGAYVHVAPGARLEKPLCFLYVGGPADAPFMAHPRNLFHIEEGGAIDLIEDYYGACDSDYFCNPVTEVYAGKSSTVSLHKLIREGAGATHVSNLGVVQKGGSSFTAGAYCFGGKTIRNDIVANLDGEGIECTLNGLTVGSGDQHIDNHTRIIHAQPNCNSWEMYKAVLTDRSHGVFNGKIFVAQDAQKTDAKQTNQSLLLSEKAVMDSKPELEIYADDVKCTHGATVGQLDEEGMFYLRSRGVPEKVARDLLVYAFASDLLTGVEIPDLKTTVDAALFDKLPGSCEPADNK